MQPKDFHEELASSAEKVEKRKRRQPPLSERVLVCDTPEMKDDDDKLERLRVSVCECAFMFVEVLVNPYLLHVLGCACRPVFLCALVEDSVKPTEQLHCCA
jgi:hypothetical protein